ncbi:MAG TPA: lipid A deacylase LpxR family protein [Usitatibacter sp.]|nr:lipid A deacylase LpxR family protein [Usitatibacter sp.]
MRGAGWLAALAVAGAANADDTAARWYLRIDNDVLMHTDRWYTAGERIARVKGPWEIAIVQEIYTPEAKYANPIDRAPTARLFASLAHHQAGEGFFQTWEVDAGVRGPSALGEQTTRAIHEVITAPHVDWSRQLPDEFDGSLVFARTQSLADWLRVHAGATLGTQVTFAHVGIEGRVGAAAAPSSSMLRFAASPPFAEGARGWSGYVGASVRGVARNELISKSYVAFNPDPTRKDGVVRIAAGFTWQGERGSVTLDVVQDSREFEEQRTAHRFGSLGLHYAF